MVNTAVIISQYVDMCVCVCVCVHVCLELHLSEVLSFLYLCLCLQKHMWNTCVLELVTQGDCYTLRQ
jgi:hypothetical protein